MKITIVTSLLLLLSEALSGQELVKIRTNFLKQIDKVSCDRYFNIYVSDISGNIVKYNQQGDSLLSYSPMKQGTITSFEAWNSIRVFAFYKDFQQFTFFDRFLGPLPKIDLPEALIGYGKVATVSADNQVWIFDEAEFSLKKYDPEQLKITSKTNCDLLLNAHDYDIAMMREYQNQLYLVDKINGILIFDNFGNYKNKIQIDGLDFIGFYKEELFYIANEEIVFIHLYLGEKRKISLPSSYNNKIIIGDSFYYLFNKTFFDIYQLKK